jgi:hypothetical protein
MFKANIEARSDRPLLNIVRYGQHVDNLQHVIAASVTKKIEDPQK